jgi:hypothetical protein
MPKSNGDAPKLFTQEELEIIVGVNRQFAELSIELGHQNENIIADISSIKTKVEAIDERSKNIERMITEDRKKITDIDQHLFRLLAVLGIIGIGVIWQLVSALFGHHG